MKFRCERDVLADALATASRAVSSRGASLPVLSGYIWEAFGFRWVFLLAGAIAVIGFFVCLQIRVPDAAVSRAGEA